LISHSKKSGNKARSKQKIDGMVALIIALSRMIAGGGMGPLYNGKYPFVGDLHTWSIYFQYTSMDNRKRWGHYT
jgi:hypothetical protein